MFQNPDLGLFILRLAVGIIFIYHSMPKLRKPGAMTGGMGMPAFAIIILGLVEFLGGAAVIIGFRTVIAALLLALAMIGAIYKKMFAWHVPFSSHEKTGWEFDLVLLAAALAIAMTSGGSYMLF